MKAVIHVNNAAHQKEHGAALRHGLLRHGVEVRFAGREQPTPADIVCIWGWKQPRVIAEAQRRGSSILVMERGHVQPRMEWTACGWNGLGHRGRYVRAADGGDRWRAHHDGKVLPWRTAGGDRALLCGQVEGDAALYNLAGGFQSWAQRICDRLRAAGWRVLFRPHPLSRRTGAVFLPRGAELTRSERLHDDLAQAGLCVTYNSTAGVEAVLAGVPTLALDEGAMAWPVAGHALGEPAPTPERAGWCHDLAWTSWRMGELADGSAVERLLAARPGG